ncbi:type I-C CRISPR-associated protein Cas5 [candidate division KSB3 bacterium]|uniref:pre-crRNA processing endonuclease n=1 Tax=candidate division KSB3 bacterium TaxID=2044937 RepID=A0A2G6E2M9_9BACT|nr:MAG: type I-C CRISPR-associated protein Cas5 [candidate division KSB3 bacterium]PIE28684.1 MAG: type I-C CRISPR-associated protein Cas5 [candidate division KSB3 bacterium]
MSFGVKMKVWGDYACFTRPEMKVERVSYDVITPSAARAVISAVYWKPAIRWIIDKIHVLNPIKFDNIRRNEIGNKLSASAIAKGMTKNEPVEIFVDDSKVRQQRAAMVLRDVAYIIEAHFEAVTRDGSNEGKHLDTFNRRLRKGQCVFQPYLGTREFSANFGPVDDIPSSELAGEIDLGFMLFDMDFSDQKHICPMFYRPKMIDGIITVPHPNSEEVYR